jgi:hypothetical protein
MVIRWANITYLNILNALFNIVPRLSVNITFVRGKWQKQYRKYLEKN